LISKQDSAEFHARTEATEFRLRQGIKEQDLRLEDLPSKPTPDHPHHWVLLPTLAQAGCGTPFAEAGYGVKTAGLEPHAQPEVE
jgi:hypothetical protein